MAIIEITTEARCKHCKFLERGRLKNKDGNESKRVSHFCGNINSLRYKQVISLRDLVCSNWDV